MTETSIKKYKGDRKFKRGVNKMSKDGWQVHTVATRKAWWSLLTGVFTRKQIHMVTFTKAA
jgi:hypothetical protein